MAKYRKKPIVIEAVQFTGETKTDPSGICRCNEVALGGFPHIHTLEGTMNLNHGDWIIRGVKGEYYPCKPDIFEQTYEKVED